MRLHEHEPARLAVFRLKTRDRASGTQGLVIFRKRNFKLVDIRGEVCWFPAEDALSECSKVRKLGNDLAVPITQKAVEKLLMLRRDVAIDLSLSRKQCRRRHDETDRLNITDPFQVCLQCRIFRHAV